MDKTLIAAAGLALAGGCACAQSSLTLYGLVDAGVAHMNNGASITAFSGAGSRGATSVKTGWPNRLGLRATEDLGAGLSGWIHLEHRFNVDDGSPQTPWWTGRSVVGLSSTQWGEVALGRDYLPAFWQALNLDPWQWSTVGQVGYIYTWARYTGAEQVPRNNNMVSYRTPDFGGLTATLAYTFSEGSTTRGNALGGNAIYSKGPVYAAFAFDRLRNPGAGPDARLLSLGGSYDFKVVKPRVQYSTARSFTNVETNSLMLAATVPVGAGRVLAAASRLRVSGPDNDATKVGLGYHHDLSRRTMLYVNFATAKVQNASRSTGYDLGIRHSF